MESPTPNLRSPVDGLNYEADLDLTPEPSHRRQLDLDNIDILDLDAHGVGDTIASGPTTESPSSLPPTHSADLSSTAALDLSARTPTPKTEKLRARARSLSPGESSSKRRAVETSVAPQPELHPLAIRLLAKRRTRDAEEAAAKYQHEATKAAAATAAIDAAHRSSEESRPPTISAATAWSPAVPNTCPASAVNETTAHGMDLTDTDLASRPAVVPDTSTPRKELILHDDAGNFRGDLLRLLRALRSLSPPVSLEDTRPLRTSTGGFYLRGKPEMLERILQQAPNTSAFNGCRFVPPRSVRPVYEVVLRGVDATIAEEHILQELRDIVGGSEDHIRSVRRLHQRTEGKIDRERPLPAVVAQVVGEEMRDLLTSTSGITLFGCLRVRTGKPQAVANLPQCTRCKRWGHQPGSCRSAVRCVQCGGTGHLRNACPNPQAAPSCINCGGQHSVHWAGCKARRTALERLKPTNTRRAAPESLRGPALVVAGTSYAKATTVNITPPQQDTLPVSNRYAALEDEDFPPLQPMETAEVEPSSESPQQVAMPPKPQRPSRRRNRSRRGNTETSNIVQQPVLHHEQRPQSNHHVANTIPHHTQTAAQYRMPPPSRIPPANSAPSTTVGPAVAIPLRPAAQHNTCLASADQTTFVTSLLQLLEDIQVLLSTSRDPAAAVPAANRLIGLVQSLLAQRLATLQL